MDKLLHDCHTHLTLCDEDIPKYAFGWITPYLLKNDKRANFVAKWLHRFIPFTRKDQLDRLAQLIKENRVSSRERIDSYLRHFQYVNVLLMDLESSMHAGPTKRTYEEQIIESIKLKEEFGNRIFIYMMINPEREDILELIEKYYDKIDGYKYYPPLTGSINNQMMDFILLKYPKDNIIIHTTNTSPIFDRDLDKETCGMFANPLYTLQLARKHVDKNFILAHSGGLNWLNDCVSCCSKANNVHVDISYTFEDEDTWDKLDKIYKIIPDKILFGTDWYMIDYESFTKIPLLDKLIDNNKIIFKIDI